MRRLIVTADDVGLHPGMTEGALVAYRDGIVTACSISANGRHLEDAAARLREHPGLARGVHFTLVGEAPVSPPERVRSLIGRNGRFLDGWLDLLRRYLLGRVDLDEVELELRAQVGRLRSVGLDPVHANGHQHVHVLPGIFSRVLRVAADEGIAYLRIPREKSVSRLGARRLALAGLERCGRLARRAIEEHGARFLVADATPGLAVAGRLDQGLLVALLAGVPSLAELVVHPGVGTHAIARDYAWGYRWDAETSALCSDVVRDAVAARGIELVSIPC
jgi:chitin disaccharide deacetylase